MPVTTLYCTQSDMERYFSAAGVTAFSDHTESGSTDTDVVDDCIDQATEEINLHAMQFYSATALSGSTLINRWCTTLATYFLCERRGNPPPDSVGAEFERIMAKLEMVGNGTLRLAGVPWRSDMRPSWSNLKVDRRYEHRRIRVERPSSTQAASTERTDFVEDRPFE